MNKEIVVDTNTWKRKEIFDFFSNLSNPFYMISFRQDVTALYKYAKTNNLSFYYCMCFLCTKALNSVDAFNYVIRGDKIIHLEGRNPSFTDLKKGSDMFHIVTMELVEDMKEFVRLAKEKSDNQEVFIEMNKETDDLVYISTIPWVDITAVTNERDLANPHAKDDSIPRICWGKYIDVNGRLELGISIEVNHRLIDGVHIGEFANKLTELISCLK